MAVFKTRYPYLLIFLTSVLEIINAYEGGICDEPQRFIFCTCDTRHKETTVVCYVTGNVSRSDPVWRSMGDIENVVTFKLNSMLPTRLEFIPTETIEYMHSLRDLTVQQAKLGVLEPSAISDLKELRDLKLDYNEITALERNSISNLPKLKTLSLSENLLQEVLAESVVGLDELEHLFLDRNNITRVGDCAFCDLQNLRELELWGNQITDLTQYMFKGLRYLKRLDLYKNHIRILNDKVFHLMPKLAEIDLKDNMISYVAPNAFYGLENLQRLMLNRNKIKMLPDQVFDALPNLRTVDLYENHLETLQVQVVDSMVNVKDEHFSFTFKKNPFKCDCRLSWMKDYLKINRSRVFTSELKEVQCKPEGNDKTLMTVHLMEMDCSQSKQNAMPQNSIATESDVQDDEIVKEMAEQIDNGSTGHSLSITGDIRLISFFLVALTVPVFKGLNVL